MLLRQKCRYCGNVEGYIKPTGQNGQHQTVYCQECQRYQYHEPCGPRIVNGNSDGALRPLVDYLPCQVKRSTAIKIGTFASNAFKKKYGRRPDKIVATIQHRDDRQPQTGYANGYGEGDLDLLATAFKKWLRVKGASQDLVDKVERVMTRAML